jgi:hypothetical protein
MPTAPSEPVSDELAEAGVSGFEPIGISAPMSATGIDAWSGEESGDSDRDGRERQGGGHGQDSGSE